MGKQEIAEFSKTFSVLEKVLMLDIEFPSLLLSIIPHFLNFAYEDRSPKRLLLISHNPKNETTKLHVMLALDQLNLPNTLYRRQHYKNETTLHINIMNTISSNVQQHSII